MSIIDNIKQQVQITDYAGYMGFTLRKKGKYYSLKEHDSVMIDTAKNKYWQNSVAGTGGSIGSGGSVIDFAMAFGSMTLDEAIYALKSYGNVTDEERYITAPKEYIKEKTFRENEKELVLPAASENMKKVYAYLVKTRKISPAIVREFTTKKMLYQDKRGNCVFVGYDYMDKDKPVFACKRGTNTYNPFHGDVPGCDYSRCFYVDNGSTKLLIGEAVIDIMSIMTLLKFRWKEYNYLAIGGVGKWQSVDTYLAQNTIKTVIIATDHDEKGILAAQNICAYIKDKYPFVKRKWGLPKKKKDWNEVLNEYSTEISGSKNSIAGGMYGKEIKKLSEKIYECSFGRGTNERR